MAHNKIIDSVKKHGQVAINNDMVKGYLYAGDDETETDQPLAVIADGVRNDDDDSKRMLWVDESLTHVEPLTDNYLKRQGAATEKQLDEYDA